MNWHRRCGCEVQCRLGERVPEARTNPLRASLSASFRSRYHHRFAGFMLLSCRSVADVGWISRRSFAKFWNQRSTERTTRNKIRYTSNYSTRLTPFHVSPTRELIKCEACNFHREQRLSNFFFLFFFLDLYDTTYVICHTQPIIIILNHCYVK